MYNIYAIVILILFDIPRFSVNDLHQIQVAAPSPSSRKSNIELPGLGPIAINLSIYAKTNRIDVNNILT